MKIVCQLDGRSIYQQGDMEVSIGPDDRIVYDVPHPDTIIKMDRGRHLVIALTKDIAIVNAGRSRFT